MPMTWMMIVALAFCSPETCRGSCHPWRGGSSARWRENSNRTDTRGWRGGQPLLLQLLTNESTVWPFLTTQGPVLRSLWTEKYLRESSMQRRSISHSIKSYPAVKLLRLRKALNVTFFTFGGGGITTVLRYTFQKHGSNVPKKWYWKKILFLEIRWVGWSRM